MYIGSGFYLKTEIPLLKNNMNLYQYSGKVGYSPVLLLLVALPLMAVFGGIYAYITVYNPIAGYLTVLIMIGYIFLCGLAVSMLLKLGKCRSKTFCFVGGLIGSLFSLYFAWLFFLYALLHRFEYLEVGLLDILLSPSEMWNTILEINRTGWFKIKGGTPSGIVLWIFWGIEALAILLGVTLIGSSAIDDEMFCEKCSVWCDVTESKYLKMPTEIASSKAKDINPLTLNSLENAESNVRPTIQAELIKCPNCINYAGWRYKVVSSEIDKDGNEKDSTATIPGIVLTV
jgi:hypothetical protein